MKFLGRTAFMPFATRSRRMTLLVLAAYLAAHTLGAPWHEQLHAQAGDETCCHGHDHAGRAHPAKSDGTAANGELGATSQDHFCIVCRLAGQPIVPATAAATEVSADVCSDALPCPAAAPRTLAGRLAQSRAPPTAA